MLTNCLAQCAHLTNRFSDRARYWSKIVIFSYPLAFDAPLGGFPSDYHHPVWCGKTRMVWLPDSEKISKISLFVLAQLTNVTDGQTERQTDRRTDTAWRHIPRLCICIARWKLSKLVHACPNCSLPKLARFLRHSVQQWLMEVNCSNHRTTTDDVQCRVYHCRVKTCQLHTKRCSYASVSVEFLSVSQCHNDFLQPKITCQRSYDDSALKHAYYYWQTSSQYI